MNRHKSQPTPVIEPPLSLPSHPGLRRSLLPWGLLLALATPLVGQTWSEDGDAMSFPDQAAQVTRGSGPLALIEGSTPTTGAPSDIRDAYCIRIQETFFFLATTDPSSHPDASATFDTRLFLFDAYGQPVLANDDSAGGGTSRSTLQAIATDGSGFTLEQNGQYVLVVTGADEIPTDSTGADLFDLAAGASLIHAPASGAGAFAEWDSSLVETGSYSVALEGAKFCQENLSVVFAKSGDPDQICSLQGDSISNCHDRPSGGGTESKGLAMGYLNPNEHLDLVVAVELTDNQVCSGSETGLAICTNIASSPGTSQDVALRDLDGDTHLDAVFARTGDNNSICFGDGGGLFLGVCSDLIEFSSQYHDSLDVDLGHIDGDAIFDVIFATDNESNRVCLGDGTGFFQTCTSVSTATDSTQAVALGRVDGDNHLDTVFANAAAPDEVCLGLGDGTFTCSEIDTLDHLSSFDVALGFADDDLHLDAVFARGPETENVVCLGDGLGPFTCSPVSNDDDDTVAVALGYANDDNHLDAVFGGDQDSVCLGDGSGGFDCSDVSSNESSQALLSSPPSTDIAIGPLFDLNLLFADGFETGDSSAWSP